MDFDGFLKKGGEFGRYQIYLFFLTAPFIAFLAIGLLGPIYISATPEHWCKVPELANVSVEERKQLSIPHEENLGIQRYSRCSRYNGTYEEIMAGLGLRGELPVIPCQNGWEYNLTEIPYHTIVSEYDWVCSRDNYASIAQALFFVGSIVAGIGFGYASDKVGRVPVLMCANLFGAVAGSFTAFVTNFWQFALCRFFMGFSFNYCFYIMYIVAVEYVGPRYRTLVATLCVAVFSTIFNSLVPWVAYGISDWRLFCLCTSLPMLFGLLSHWLVPESARWLVSAGKVKRAMKIMRNYFKVNNAEVTEQEMQEFEAKALKLAEDLAADEVSYSIRDLMKSPRLKRNTILLVLFCMAVNLCYDGQIRNVSNLGYNMFVSSSLLSSMELPADILLILLLDRVGRRWLSFLTLLLNGLFCASSALVPTDERALYLTLGILGYFSISITFNISMQYAAELLPTVVRGQGIVMIHMMGIAARILSPAVVYLATYGQFVPLLIFGSASLIGGFISLFLPETLYRQLPESLEEGESFGKDQKFWSFPCCDKSIHYSLPNLIFRKSRSFKTTRKVYKREYRYGRVKPATIG